MALPKLNRTLHELRNEIRNARSTGSTDGEIVNAIVWAIDSIDHNWAVVDSEGLSGKLAWILAELPYTHEETTT